jgi:hypothetical protein
MTLAISHWIFQGNNQDRDKGHVELIVWFGSCAPTYFVLGYGIFKNQQIPHVIKENALFLSL